MVVDGRHDGVAVAAGGGAAQPIAEAARRHRHLPAVPRLRGSDGAAAPDPGSRPSARTTPTSASSRRSAATARWQVTFYNREERDVLRLPGSELRVEDGRLVGFVPTAPWINALDGYARGVEVLVQRRSTSGLSGWVSYSFGVQPVSRPHHRRVVRRRLRSAPHVQRLRPVSHDRSVQPGGQAADRQQRAGRRATGSSAATRLLRRFDAQHGARAASTRGSTCAPTARSTGRRSG